MVRSDAALPKPPRILVVDDDPGIRELLAEYLSQQGFDARTAASAAEMDRALADTQRPDLIVLDVMMPGEDGLSVVRRLSGKGPPIVMLSAMGEDTDRIVGLELGADDYLPKPCNPRELLARIKAVLRRPQVSVDDAPALLFAGWRLDLVQRSLTRPDGGVLNLTPGEFALLRAFAESPGRVLTRDQLLEKARGDGADIFDRAMDVQISRLRKKLDDGSSLELIRTLRGEGYSFSAKVTRSGDR